MFNLPESLSLSFASLLNESYVTGANSLNYYSVILSNSFDVGIFYFSFNVVSSSNIESVTLKRYVSFISFYSFSKRVFLFLNVAGSICPILFFSAPDLNVL